MVHRPFVLRKIHHCPFLVEERLHSLGSRTYVFDGDNVWHGLCGDLDFSPQDRTENIRRIAEMVRLFLDAGILCLAAFISPLCEDRELVRQLVGPRGLLEVYVKCPVEACEQRDIKGLYKKARQGEIKNYTGVSAPYEPPGSPDLVLETDTCDLEDCVTQVMNLINQRS